MAEKKQTVIDEALLEMKKIEEALKANSKGILHSVLKEEIEGYVNESINEEDYEEEEIEVTDDEATTDELPIDPEAGEEAEEENGEEEVEELPLGDDSEEEVEGGEEEMELPVDLDMTDASDEDVISVYKKLSGDDEIEVVSDNEVKIKDPESGNEYVVALGGETETGLPVEDETEAFEEEAVYEIELQEEGETTNEDIVRGQGHDTHVGQTTPPNTGDIDGQNSPEDKDTSGDNLDGGFDEDTTSGDGHAEHVMEGEDVNEEEVTEETEVTEGEEIDEAAGDTIFREEPKASMNEDEEVNEEEVTENEEISEEDVNEDETIEEKIQVGKGRNVTTKKTSIEGAGAKANNVKRPNVTANESLEDKYNALVKEAAQLKKENGEFKASLKKFREMLTETVIFNSNLAHVVKIITEHTTTKEEKKQIIKRFDDEVSSLSESKKLYKAIVSELGNKKTVTETVESKINDSKTSGKTNLTESTAYVDKSTERIIDLISRVEQR
jgi:hypothetical protein